jgi:hypothetical protein
MSSESPSPERAGGEITPPEDTNRRTSKVAGLFPKEFHAQDPPFPDDKKVEHGLGTGLPAYEGEDRAREAVSTAEDLVTRVINVEDDPSLDPWTFRTFFLGSLKATIPRRQIT